MVYSNYLLHLLRQFQGAGWCSKVLKLVKLFILFIHYLFVVEGINIQLFSEIAGFGYHNILYFKLIFNTLACKCYLGSLQILITHYFLSLFLCEDGDNLNQYLFFNCQNTAECNNVSKKPWYQLTEGHSMVGTTCLCVAGPVTRDALISMPPQPRFRCGMSGMHKY